MSQPEQRARERIDQLLEGAGRALGDAAQANLSGTRSGIAIREFPMKTRHRFADLLPYVNGKRRVPSRRAAD